MLRKLGKDVASYGVGDLALRLVGFLVFPVYAHVLSVEEFGILALITTGTAIVALVANPGLNMAMTRYYWDPELTPAMRPLAVSTGLMVLVAWSLTVVLLAIVGTFPARGLLASRYGAAWMIVLIGLLTIVPEHILQYCLNVVRLQASPWKFTLVSFFKNVFGIAIGLVLILGLHQGLRGLFTGALAGALIGAPVALVLIRGDLLLGFHLATAKRLLAFGYPFIFAGLAYWMFGSIDRWMLAQFCDTTQVGLYSIAYKFAGVVLFLNGAFGQAWSPFALKLRRDDAGYRTVYARLFSMWFFFLALAGSTMVLFGDEALRLLTPREYWTAAPALAPLVMGVVLLGTTQITAIGISLENKTRLFAAAAWVTALVNVLLNLLLIPRLAAVGAALATFLSYALLTALYLFWSQKFHPIPLQRAKLLYSTCLVLLATSIGMWLSGLGAWSVAGILAKCALLGLMLAGGVVLGIIDVAQVRALRAWWRTAN